MSRLPLALALLAGCAADDVTSDTTQDVTTTSTVTTRGVNLTANVLADWGGPKQISQTLVANQTLVVRYCAEHFPAGSQALANLTSAVATYSAAAAVAIDLSDVAAAAGTNTHPNLATFTFPADAIYVDYDALAKGYAATSFSSCDSSSPKQCTQAKILVTDTSPAFTDPLNTVDEAPSVGVFMHELGHVFGLSHLNEDDDSVVLLNPNDMWFDRTTIHGWKTNDRDFRSTVIHAGTLAFLLEYYPDADQSALATDEIVAHRNMSVVDGTGHIEFNPSKSYQEFGTAASAIADINETKLRWSSTAGDFEPCSAYGTLPRWFARMSETSTNTTDKAFQSVFEVTNSDAGTTWTEVATHTFDSYIAGQQDFRQIDWEKTFQLTAADVGVAGGSGITATTYRKLRFRADANHSLTERNESNDEWHVNICLYPESNTTCSGACAQP